MKELGHFGGFVAMEMDSEHLGEYKFVHTCTFACKRSHKNYFYYFFLSLNIFILAKM